MGVGQENRTDGFVDFLDGLANGFPMATWVNHNQVLVSLYLVGVFIGNRIDSFMDFHRISSLKECTDISITQKRRLRVSESLFYTLTIFPSLVAGVNQELS